MARNIEIKKRKPLTAEEITARKRAMVRQHMEYQSEKMGGSLIKSKKKPLTDKEKAMVGQHMEHTSEMIGGSLIRRKKNRIKRKKHMGMQSKKKKEPMPITYNR